MTDSDSILVCMRVSDAPIVVAGSTKHKCADCKCWVWASPASLAIARKKRMTILCMPCGAKRAKEDDDVEVAKPTTGQIKEMCDTLRKDFTERG
jgi:hypothetical protein